MNRSLAFLLVSLLAFAMASQEIRLVKLERQRKELINHIADLGKMVQQQGDELDNLETKLHIDKESIQN